MSGRMGAYRLKVFCCLNAAGPLPIAPVRKGKPLAIHFNESTIAPILTADGVARQPLLNKQRMSDILFELDRLTIFPAAIGRWRLQPATSHGFR
jgi:hypothetical protein